MNIRVMAAFSYLGVLCLVPLLFSRGNGYVDFHARQGLVLWVWSVCAVFAMHLPGMGPYLFSTSSVMVALLSLVGLVSVALNRSWKIPLVAKLAGLIDVEQGKGKGE